MPSYTYSLILDVYGSFFEDVEQKLNNDKVRLNYPTEPRIVS